MYLQRGEENVIAALIKALEYFGTVFLLGAGVYGLFIAPVTRAPLLIRGASVGAAVLIVSSLADVTWKLRQVLGRFDPELTLSYLLGTTGGQLTLLRVALVLVTLGFLTFIFVMGTPKQEPTRSPWRWGFTALGLGVLYSFSAASHAAVMHGPGALVPDLAHFVAASAWGGAVLYTSLAWRTLGRARLEALERVSRVGLFAVILLLLSGVYASTLHLEGFTQLVSTPYGLVLSVKLGIVALILGIAALNRWHFLPRLRADPQTYAPFGRILQAEAYLLLAVFATTGLLSTSPLPHD